MLCVKENLQYSDFCNALIAKYIIYAWLLFLFYIKFSYLYVFSQDLALIFRFFKFWFTFNNRRIIETNAKTLNKRDSPNGRKNQIPLANFSAIKNQLFVYFWELMGNYKFDNILVFTFIYNFFIYLQRRREIRSEVYMEHLVEHKVQQW